MSPHTPGPWNVRTGADGYWLIAAAETERTMIVVAREINEEADARLISIVPEMHEALNFIATLDKDGQPLLSAHSMVTLAVAALNAARDKP